MRPLLTGVPLIEIQPGYWERAGILRAKVLAQGRKALGDALIAQTCLDKGIAVITRNRDFQAFTEAASLRIVVPGKK
jgi:predicted nucleic acid-binding protein